MKIKYFENFNENIKFWFEIVQIQKAQILAKGFMFGYFCNFCALFCLIAHYKKPQNKIESPV